MAVQNTEITCNVKAHRLAKGWTQGELAERAGIRRQAVYDIESGRYLPNTAIALRLAHIFGCLVEALFVVEPPPGTEAVHLLGGDAGPSTRLALGRVRDRLIGLPLDAPDAFSSGFRAADGLLSEDKKSARIFSPASSLDQTVVLMGCDPAFELLGQYVSRVAPEARVLCRFASSTRSLNGLAEGVAHVAGTHLHNTGGEESNLIAADRQLAQVPSGLLGFSLMEEGLMVAKGNPLGIRSVADLADPKVRFVNREPGAALRVLLDDHLGRSGVPVDAIHGYANAVGSHRDGACRIACNVADAALGLRAVADAYGLGFVPIAVVRCDLVIPVDLAGHPTIKIIQDVLQSAALRRELDHLPGYEGSVTGQVIA